MQEGYSRTASKALLQGLGKVLIVVAGLSFFWGGRALHDFCRVDRLLGELGGLTLAVLAGLLGMLAKGSADSL